MKNPRFGASVVVAAALLSFACEVRADIIFGGPQNITTEAADVLTAGTTHAAVNATADGEANATLSGIIFESGNINDATNVSTAGFTSDNNINVNDGLLGDTADYQRVIGQLDFGGTQGVAINIDNLVVGNLYDVQVWFLDGRDGTNGTRVSTITGEGGSSVQLNDQFAIGSFTATTTTESFTVSTTNSRAPNLNAFQVRDLGPAPAVVPEPSSLAMLGLGGLALLVRRKK